MTKFEEEVDKVAKQVGYESLSLLIGDCEEAKKIYIHFKNWHSDEEFQELSEKLDDTIDALDIARNSRDEFEREYKKLKSQLQQQALPVVPEGVVKWLKSKPLYQLLEDILIKDVAPLEIDEWFDNPKNWTLGIGTLDDFIARLKLDGYTVEKPQQKRYEVKLLSGESMQFNPIGNPKNIKDYRFSFGNYAGWKTQFTKSELAEIKDGIFLKRIPGGTPLDDLGKDKSYYVWIEDCNYWKNPFIELVPVEDEE